MSALISIYSFFYDYDNILLLLTGISKCGSIVIEVTLLVMTLLHTPVQVANHCSLNLPLRTKCSDYSSLSAALLSFERAEGNLN